MQIKTQPGRRGLHQSPLSLLHLLTVACAVCVYSHTYHSFVVAILNTLETQQTDKQRVSTFKEWYRCEPQQSIQSSSSSSPTPSTTTIITRTSIGASILTNLSTNYISICTFKFPSQQPPTYTYIHSLSGYLLISHPIPKYCKRACQPTCRHIHQPFIPGDNFNRSRTFLSLPLVGYLFGSCSCCCRVGGEG